MGKVDKNLQTEVFSVENVLCNDCLSLYQGKTRVWVKSNCMGQLKNTVGTNTGKQAHSGLRVLDF